MHNGRLAKISSLLRRAVRLAGRAEELIDRVLYELQQLGGNHPAPIPRTLTLPRQWQTGTKPVDVVTMRLGAGGHSQIHAENLSAVDLTPRLTALLRFASAAPPDEEGTLSFRLLTEAAAALRTSTRAVTNLIYRLRQALHERGWNPFLVQTTGSKDDAKFRLLVRKLEVIEPP